MSDPLSITASIVAVLQLSATATKFLKDVKGGASDKTRLRDELRSTVLLLEMLKDRVEDAEDQWATSMGVFAGPEGPLHQFRVTLELLISKIASSQSKATKVVQALRWPFDMDDVNKFLRALERQKSLFLLAMQNDHIKLSQEMHQKLHQIGQTLDNMRVGQERALSEHVVGWICPISFRKKQADVLSQMQPGTGQWLLQNPQFLSWVATRNARLWCSGIPGAGKTVLASMIIEHIQQNCLSADDGLAYIYCEYSLHKEQTVINLVSSIIQQLMERLPVLPSSVRSFHERHKQQRSGPELAEWTTLLKECLLQFSTISIVIDALDEYSETNGTRELLISAIQQLGPNVRFLCTSRFLVSIKRSFQAYTRLEIQANDHDVKIFVRQRIEQETRLRTHTQSEPSLVELISNTIIAEVQGMFLLAKLHIESLAQKQTRKSLRAALRALPKGLDETYKEAMRRIHNQSEDDVLLAERVIYWLSYALQPLTVLKLQHAIAAQDVEKEDRFIDSDSLPTDDIMIAVCCGLVIIDTESQIIRLVHYTTQDYFERARGQLFPTAPVELAKACLTYLTLENFSSGPCRTDADMKERLESMPFLNYAAKFWGSHARMARVESCWDDIISLIDDDNAVQISTQVFQVAGYSYSGWSQGYARSVPKLIYVASVDLPEVLEHVLREAPDLENSDSEGQTALMEASRLGRIENVRLLLEAGASVDTEDALGRNALSYTADSASHEVLNLLLEAGASTLHQESDGWTALMSATHWRRRSSVTKLIHNGADVNAVSRGGNSALTFAVFLGDKICQTLLDAGAVLPRTYSGAYAKLVTRRECNEHIFKQLRFAQRAPGEEQEDELEKKPNWGAHELDELELLVKILKQKKEEEREKREEDWAITRADWESNPAD